jgi:hypothetical protein
MLFRSISFNSTKSLKLMWKPSVKSTGQNKLLVQSIQYPQPKFFIDDVGFGADELYNEKLFDNLANKAKRP